MKRIRIYLLASLLVGCIVLINSLSIRRAHANTFTVTTIADNGNNAAPTAGSLRKAIIDANASSGLDTITFNIPGGGVQTIQPPAALPIITSPVIIDGTTQPGSVVNTGTATNNAVINIVLSGDLAAGTANGLLLGAGSSGSTIRGLVIGNFNGNGVRLDSSSNKVQGCFIGVSQTGNAFLSNANSGVLINATDNNIIGTEGDGANDLAEKNILTGNLFHGVRIVGASASNNTVKGNFIGTRANGAALGNKLNGVDIDQAVNNTIGGTTVNERNIISSNESDGVEIHGSGATGNVVQGNFIGTTANGLADLGNTIDGVLLNGVANNTIGGNAATPGAGAGNVISGNDRSGIALSNSDSNNVQGNILGLTAVGNAALENTTTGITIEQNSDNNIIGGLTGNPGTGLGNVISGNNSNGIDILGADTSGNSVLGNIIGLDVGGTVSIENNAGIFISQASANTIGGATSTARNIISGNNVQGISIAGASANGNTVQGNFIGTSRDGTLKKGNSAGILISSGVGPTIIGGSVTAFGAAPGNVISGNNGAGIELAGNGSTVQGNIIGLNATGTAGLGNGVGINIAGSGNTVGGDTAASGNIVASSTGGGIVFNAATASNNNIRNNFIGTNAAGANLGNLGAGVLVSVEATNNSVGGGVGLGNTIAFNSVGISAPKGTGNAFFANSIHSNNALGIDLGGAGVTVNDPLDVDTGANNLQNFPVVGIAANNGISTFISGTLNSAPNQIFTIEFFSNPVCDPSSNGEGQFFLGAINATTASDGNIIFNVTLPVTVAAGQFITATATDAAGNTSEFSVCKQITTAAPALAEFVNAEASGFTDGVYLKWQTGMEYDNLGFNLYRNTDGKQARVNEQLVAGSALKTGQGIAVHSGFAYEWWDSTPAAKSTHYMIEAVDLNGTSQWFGPFYPQPAIGSKPQITQPAKALAALGKGDGPTEQVLPQVQSSGVVTSSVMKTSLKLLPPAVAGNAVKVQVKQAGFYRLTQAELITAGLDAALDPRYLQLLVGGREQAIRVNGEEDGRFDPSDTVEFFGTGQDSPYSNAQVYWLATGKALGKRIATQNSAAKPGPLASFAATVERRDRTIYFSGLLNGDRENFFGAVLVTQSINQTLNVRSLDDSATESAALEVALQGVTQIRHDIIVQLNGSMLGTLSFNGRDSSSNRFSVAPSLLREGDNTVTLRNTGNPSDVSLIDYLRLTYQRRTVAHDNRLFCQAPGGAALTLGGFTGKRIRVFDVTSADAVAELTGAIEEDRTGYQISLRPLELGERTLLAITDEALQTPAKLIKEESSNWRSANNAAELVILTRQELATSAQALQAYRQKQGLSVALINVEDLYDEFSFGNKTPYTVKAFLDYAAKNWRVPPRYVLLFGDASYDVKNYMGLGDFDLVPTKLIDTTFTEAASDDWLADFTGDGIADLAIGRLPVRSNEEGLGLIKKVMTYEQAAASTEALSVADSNEGYNFESAIDQLKALLPANIKANEVKRGQLSATAAKAALFDALNRGQKIVSYSGHGNVNIWRGNLLTNDEAKQLVNPEKLSLFVLMTCLNGYFTDPQLDSLSEALLKAQGGAVAAWASTALTYPDSQSLMNQALYRELFAHPEIRLGDAIRRAKATAIDNDVRLSWVLFADPTMRLR